MAIITAQQYRAQRAPRAIVTIPGTDLTLEVKRVDVIAEAVAGRLDAQAVDDLLAIIPSDDFLEAFRANAERFAGVIDALICAGAVSPRVAHEPQSADSPVLWIAELDLPTKLAILKHVTGSRHADASAPEATPQTA